MGKRHIGGSQTQLAKTLRKLYPDSDIGYGRNKQGPYVICKGVAKDKQTLIICKVAGDPEEARVVYR